MNPLSLMESKFIAGLVISLILGIGVGYVTFDNSDDINQAQNEIASIQTTLSDLENDYNTLEREHIDLMNDFERILRESRI